MSIIEMSKYIKERSNEACIEDTEERNNVLIDVTLFKKNNVKLRSGLISPESEEIPEDVVSEHDAEPIKDMNTIMKISKYLISKDRYRDNMLFIVGINFGLRVSDLRVLRFCNLINNNLTFKDSFQVFEKKTRNTRKIKKNRHITINRAVIEAVTLYLENTHDVKLNDYMFTSNANRNKFDEEPQPLTVRSIDRILKGIAKDLDLNMRVSTHTLRKTFAYHQMVMSHNDQRKLLLLQKMFNHSSPSQTLDYIGITREEMEDAYRNLNLGSESNNYLANTNILEYSC